MPKTVFVVEDELRMRKILTKRKRKKDTNREKRDREGERRDKRERGKETNLFSCIR